MNAERAGSTARTNGIDLSPESPRASTSPVRRVERCVCGGRIILYFGESARDAVALHNGTSLHLRWRGSR